MIVSFLDKETRAVYDGEETKAARRRLPLELWSVAQRKLDQMNSVAR